MNLQTFKATTMAEALLQVKASLGSDAMILHTRTYRMRRWLGLRNREIVEITASRALHASRRAQRQTAAAARPLGYARNAAAVATMAAGSALAPGAASPAGRFVPDGGRQFLETPAAGNAAILGLSQEMGAIKSLVKDLLAEARSAKSPQVPENLFEYYLQLIQSQVAEELAGDLIRTLQSDHRPELLAKESFVREKLAEQLERMLPTSGPIARTKTVGPHVVALIGPTGVGKTTTLAKLAANLKLREKHRVGLITLDTYRIAAIDQLRRYADIIGSPLKVVASSEDLKESVRSMSDCEYILIDTAGRSPNDTMKLNELRTLLTAASPDEVHLVLSTTSSQACVELAMARFNEVRVDKVIFTKLDEAAHVGVVLNVMRKVGKSLSYVTTGQDVPDDIEVGRGRRLAQMILGQET